MAGLARNKVKSMIAIGVVISASSDYYHFSDLDCFHVSAFFLSSLRVFKARDSTVCPFYYTYLCTSHFVYLRGHARADLRRICGLKVKVRGFINTQQPKLATTKEECVSERGGMAEHNKNLLPLLFASLGLKTVLLLFASIPFLEPDLTLTMEVNGGWGVTRHVHGRRVGGHVQSDVQFTHSKATFTLKDRICTLTVD